MLSKFYQYLMINVSKKKSLWVINGLIWLYFIIILLIIPAIMGINYVTLWTNSMFNFNCMTIIFLSMYCAILAVSIFNQPREDGSELIIFSKPIYRWKIIIGKFFVFLSFVLINILGSLIIPLFCFCFGPYDSYKRPTGFELDKIAYLELSIFVATTVVSLFFGSLAILISMKASKQTIMVSTISVSIFFEIISMVIPMVAKSPSSALEDRYGISIKAINYRSEVTKSSRCLIYQDDGIIDQKQEFEYTTSKLNSIGNKEAGLLFLNAIDINDQFGSLYKMGSLSGLADADMNEYGANSRIHYVTKEANAVFNDINDPCIDMSSDSPFDPIIVPKRDGDGNWKYELFGVDQDMYALYNMAGCTRDSAFLLQDNTNLIKSLFYSYDQAKFTDKNGDDVVLEHKEDGEYKANGIKEYADIRNAIFNYILGKQSSINLDNLDKWFATQIYKFLYLPVHEYADSQKEVAASGMEVVQGISIDEANEVDLNLAICKVLYSLLKETYDLFYGSNLEHLAMYFDDFSDQNPFITKLTSEIPTESEWTLYNGYKASGPEICSKYRFLFYSDFLNRYLLGNERNNNAFGRLIRIVNGSDLLFFEYTSGYALTTKQEVESDNFNPQDHYSEVYYINQTKNTVPTIRALRSSTYYSAKKYVSNTFILIFWTCVSIALFSLTLAIYWRTDIK